MNGASHNMYIIEPASIHTDIAGCPVIRVPQSLLLERQELSLEFNGLGLGLRCPSLFASHPPARECLCLGSGEGMGGLPYPAMGAGAAEGIPMSQLRPFSSYVNLVERYNTFCK